jgi:hypothetical protein
MGISIILFLLYNLYVGNCANVTSVSRMKVDLTGLTVASFVFNHDHRLPAWVQYIIGDKSVYYAADATHYQGASSTRAVDAQEASIAHQAVIKELDLPIEATKPLCSVEILGYVNLDKRWPFFRAQRMIGPLLGQGRLSTPSFSTNDTTCYYRALYENWRPESDRANPNHWSTVFYCPIYSQSLCNGLIEANTKKTEVSMTLTFTANQTTWSNDFTARISNPRIDTGGKVQEMGICMAIPYTTVDADKVSNFSCLNLITSLADLGYSSTPPMG